ncbi:MAG: hypothetical protein AAF383_01835 [Cyanobacteria bacterium P01_A01_bin.83]
MSFCVLFNTLASFKYAIASTLLAIKKTIDLSEASFKEQSLDFLSKSKIAVEDEYQKLA